tara:strand:- start:273 stop:593 length:321 start_codon:yes stop_codon:yes gene_type:complete
MENRSKENKENIQKKGAEDNTIFIGNKPLVNYIRSVITQFNRKESSEVIIKSRGKFISRAVDVAEVSKRNLQDQNIKIKDIKIASEQFESEGKTTNVSTMEIILTK